CGNVATPVSRMVNWTEDTTPPVITATGTTLSLGCNPTAAAIDAALGTATATDNCGSVTPTASDSAVSNNGCGRAQSRTWALTDACGNVATPVSRMVNWTEDTTPPVLSGCSDVTVNATAGGCGATVGFNVTASDDCDTTVQPTCDHQSGELFPVGTTTVHCNA